MAKVSVLILAKNEEKFIGACIKSVKDFADEIIVIDDFSTDKTAQISKELGARVIQRGLNGDWGGQQTFAIQQAKFDWVFFIDADERATPELSAEIKKVLSADDKNFAYRTARLSYFWGQPLKHGGWFPDYVTRLFPTKNSYVTGFVHPQIHHACQEKNFAESAYLVHYPYRDWNHYFNKLNFYTTLAAKKAHEQGKSAGVLDMILHPIWASFRMYILRGGFLDGRIGFILAGFHYFYTMAKYVKLYYYGKENRHVTEAEMFKNILVNALVNLGDVVLTTSALALIKKNFPETRITMLVKPVVKDAVIDNPVVDDVIVLDYRAKENSFQKMRELVKKIREKHFDLAISFDRKLRPALITFFARIPRRVCPSKVFDDNKSRVTLLYTDVVEISHDLNKTLQAETYQEIVRKFFKVDGHETPKFPVKNSPVADKLLARLPQAKFKIALCVKGTFPLKTWSKEYFAEVVQNLKKNYDAAFFIVGAPNDKDYADEVIKEIGGGVENFCGETSLTDLAELFRRADLFITVDTGATHIAATTGVKMVTVYGCTSPDRWHPINKNAVVFTSREPCCPCTKKTCDNPLCLKNVTPAQVLSFANKLLDES